MNKRQSLDKKGKVSKMIANSSRLVETESVLGQLLEKVELGVEVRRNQVDARGRSVPRKLHHDVTILCVSLALLVAERRNPKLCTIALPGTKHKGSLLSPTLTTRLPELHKSVFLHDEFRHDNRASCHDDCGLRSLSGQASHKLVQLQRVSAPVEQSGGTERENRVADRTRVALTA